jgi:hypothetical protein
VKLIRNKPYSGTSEFGSYLLYSVEVDGEERALFVDAGVSNKIQDLKVQAGDQIALTKVAIPNGNKIKSDIIVELIDHQTRTQAPVSGDSLKQIMEQCLKDSIEITRSLQVPLDIQKIASCLFIART